MAGSMTYTGDQQKTLLRGIQQTAPVQVPAPDQGPPALPPEALPPPPPEPAPMQFMAPPPPQGPRFVNQTTTTRQDQTRKVEETDAERAAVTDLAAARNAQVDAATGEAETKAAQAAETQTALQQQEAARQNAMAEFEQRRQEKLGQVDKFLAEQRKKFADHKETDLFKGRQGAQIMSALAAGLGAFSSAISGTPNYALQVINRNMDAHINKQVRERQKLLQNANMADEDKRDAMAALELERSNLKASYAEAAAAQRDILLAKFGVDQARREGDQVKAALMAQAASERQKIEEGKRVVVDSAVTRQSRPVQVAGAGGRGAGAQHLVRGPGGQAIFATGDEKTAKNLSEAIAARQTLQRLIKEQKDSFSKYGAEAFGEEKAARDARFTAALQTVRSLESMGALDKGTVDVFERQFPSNTGRFFGRGEGAAKLDQFAADVDGKLAAKLDAAGAPGTQVIRAVDSMTAPSGPDAQRAAAIRWASRNPRDPRAADILRANGIGGRR